MLCQKVSRMLFYVALSILPDDCLILFNANLLPKKKKMYFLCFCLSVSTDVKDSNRIIARQP